MMYKNKFVLPIIIVLLLLTLPLGILGLITHNKEAYESSNPNKLHKFEGKLYYYSPSGVYLGSYACNNPECEDAPVKVDDEHLYIQSGTKNTIANLSDKFALVYENGSIKLIGLPNGVHIGIVDAVKNYGDDTLPYIVMKKEEEGYSAFSTATGSYAIGRDYDYVGFIDSQKVHDVFAVSKDNKYYLVGLGFVDGENILSSKFDNPIYYYTDSLIVLKNNNSYGIYSYSGEIISSNNIKFDVYNGTIAVRNSLNNVYIYTSKENVTKYNADGKNYDFEITDEGISIIENGQQVEVLTS